MVDRLEAFAGLNPQAIGVGTGPIRGGEFWVNNRRKRMNIGEAVQSLKEGHKVSRAGWNGKGMWLELQTPDAHSKMSLPYVYMSTAQGDLVPWLCSQTDLLADDWGVVQ
jgi:hypothetical protein